MSNGELWSWDKMRKHAIDKKKCLSRAVVEGHIQKSYIINKEFLYRKAKQILKEGLQID